MKPPSYCWINGQIMPTHKATIPVSDHGLLYGDGIFEGMRFFNRRLFNGTKHLARLETSARATDLTIPFTQQVLTQAIEELIVQYGEETGYLRLVVTRGTGPLGLDPTHCKEASCFIIVDQLSLISDENKEKGLKLICAATRRQTGTGLDSRVKSLNYLHSILAKTEARTAGADDAIMLNSQGFVAEATAANLFVESRGQLLTPPVQDGCLAGITREEVMNIAESVNIKVQEVSLTNYDLYNAEACFLTGSGAGLLPVSEIDGRQVKKTPGDLYVEIRQIFDERVMSSGL